MDDPAKHGFPPNKILHAPTDNHTESLSPERYRELLDLLDEAARTFDRVTISIAALGGEIRAAVDARGETRCPYCRAGIEADADELVACRSCRTVLHEGCWGEHGRCPILGCAGQQADRRRVS